MGAGRPDAQVPRNDRRLPPVGATPMPSYGWPPYKGGGGARSWCTISAITNLHYQRAKPSPLWSSLCPETRIGSGLARIARVPWGKRRGAPWQGVPASHGASWRRTGGGDGGESDPHFFGAGAPPGRGRWCTSKSTTSPPLVGVALTTVIPGGKASERPVALTVAECYRV